MTMKEIKLSQGKVALVDDEDYEYLNQFKWHVFNSRGILYARKQSNSRKEKFMHRMIMNTPDDLTCDHIDHNGLNNQKDNLRNCTLNQNQYNRRANGRSKYIGVSIDKKGRINAQIKINGEGVYLGGYKTEEQAARRYDAAALYFHGEYCNLNFKKI